MSIGISRSLIDIIIKKLNNPKSLVPAPTIKYQEGYLTFQGFRDQNQTQLFSFMSKDPSNNFGVIETKYVPTIFGSFIGKIEPSKEVYDETGTIDIRFAVPMDGDYESRLEEIEQFKRNTRQEYGSFTLKADVGEFKGEFASGFDLNSQLPPEDEALGNYAFVTGTGTVYDIGLDGQGNQTWIDRQVTKEEYENVNYNYALNTSPINQQGSNIILSGIEVVYLDMTVYYRVSDSRFGNENTYFIEPLTNPSSTFPNIKLLEVGRNGAVGAVLDPSQAVTAKEVSSTRGATSFGKNATIYDKDKTINDSGNSVDSWFVERLRKAYVKGETEIEDVFKLTLNVSGETGTRNVLIENIVLNDAPGAPSTWSFGFKIANQLIIDKELEGS